MTEMTHERCSELLPRLLAEELDERESFAVEGHLETCGQCRKELRGLAAVKEGSTPLTEFERASLRRAVRGTLPPAVVRSAPTDRGWRRVAPFLSAAAALLILAFGITSAQLGGSDESASDAGGGSGGEEASVEGGATTDGGGGDSSSAAGREERVQDGPAGDPGEVTAESDVAAPDEANLAGTEGEGIPTLEVGRNFETDRLRAETRSGGPYRSAARAFDPRDAEEDRRELLRSLGRLAESRGRSGTVLRSCARSLSADRTLPVIAQYGTFGGRPSLVVGFVSARKDLYDRYLIAIWTPSSDCRDPRLLRGRLR